MNIRKEILAITEEDWDQVLSTNLKGVAVLLPGGRPHLVQQKVRQGSSTSLDFLVPWPPAAGLRGQQGGLIQLTRVMATEWRP